MKLNREDMRLYAVTAEMQDKEELLRQVAQAIEGGVRIVQLREKELKGDALLALARRFVKICREGGAISIINDSVEICRDSGADGVHLGQGDMDARQARAILGPEKIIGVSAHDAREAVQAERDGADYLGSGAAFVTGTKTDAKPIDHDTYRAITDAVKIPVVAIGGITGENMPQLAGRGLAGAAVVSAIFGKEDVRAASQELLALATKLFD